MSPAENQDALPPPRSRVVLSRRPPQRLLPAQSREQSPRWDSARVILLAFVTQVLLRPSRIGTLMVLGGMIGVVVVGAEGWWIVLGIILFQAAACALTVMWVDLAAERPWGAVGTIPRPRHPPADE
ncbi:MAG: hypothetical protein ABR608_12345 [Pseudonocardiaceae bacterium]